MDHFILDSDPLARPPGADEVKDKVKEITTCRIAAVLDAFTAP